MTDLSPDQSKALDYMLDWYAGIKADLRHCDGGDGCPAYPHTHGDGRAPVMSLGGWAGSGKTTLMKELDRQLTGDAVFGTPTHKAAGVLRSKLPGDQSVRVRTYHSLVYHMHGIFRCSITGAVVTKQEGSCTCGQSDACECPMRFDPCGKGATHTCHITQELKPERRQYLGGHRDIVIIDESSMLSKAQVEDVRSFGVPVLLVGDAGQLPPIKDAMNPWTMNPDVELTEIHRQGADSGILQAAHEVRKEGAMLHASYGRGDAVRIRRDGPHFNALLERFTPGPERALITYTNSLRSTFNRAYHGEGPPREGDRVVALGGRPYEADLVELTGTGFRLLGTVIQVHNGMSGTLRKASQRSIMTEMVVELDDHPLATPEQPVLVYIGAAPTAQFGAQGELPYNSPQRPKGSHLWDYAYALTAHKAQGSEFNQVIVMDQRPPEYQQWMYTALTRASQAVVAVAYAR